ENKLSTILRGDNSFLTKDAFGKKRKSFPSLPEISMSDILDQTDIKDLIKYDDELSFYADTTYKDIMKRYHKYYAIVHADGDNMGKVIKNLKSKEDFQSFSKKLFDYCIKSNNIIDKYGAITIFAGGDDLLFFAPVVSNNETIFDLCHNISNEFDNLFKETDATLSFGISIHYYKYPLYEALGNSRNLLFADAKSGDKNNIAFSVTKHSGQTFKSIIHKGDQKLYKNFRLFSSNIKGGKDIDNFLHSIHHKIDTNKEILKNIADNKNKLKNFFCNYFNEDIHIEYRDFFTQLIDFIYEAYQKDRDSAFDIVYATLRFIKFVQGNK
ncbi:MAG TPA: type III-B CRISPR-associated protein Cas10/Cmr2, partial [Campylobacterales bacterium]|nr:type III-B CRISPR-associated protein Cas10/Cmr2 [Campylobacterales bacterium]